MNEETVRITRGTISLEGILGLPAQAIGIVVFAHGSGSGRFSPRNNVVARYLQRGQVATLLLDLLTQDEAEDRRKVFDIDLLADRVLVAKRWLEQDDR
ncbi:MAG: alpha/beta hydrolase, partial [Nitrospiraceae bacterium]